MADRKERVILDLDNSPYMRGLAGAAAGTSAFVKQLDSADSRMSNMVQTALALAPALVPIGAAGVPALAGLSTQLGFATAGAGVMLLAFNGVGDGLKALNEYQLEPTAENFAKLQEKMRDLGPDAQAFVHFLDDLEPKLQTLREAAQSGIPGVQEGIESMLGRLPQVRDIISEIAQAGGDLAAETGKALASDDWDEFFTFLDVEARPNLLAFGHTVGNVLEGVANTWMALDPLSDDFTAGLLDWSRDFSAATENLDENEAFQEFLEYVQTNGPRAMDTLGAIGGALVELVEAAAPVGAVLLPVIEALADTLAAVADSPAGPILVGAAAGLSAISRAVALYNAANGSALMGFLGGVRKESVGVDDTIKKTGSGLAVLNERVAGLKTGLRIGGAALGTFALSMTDVDDKAGLSNTAMLATMGLVAGPWGAAIGGGVGLALDMADAHEKWAEALEQVNDAARSDDLAQMLDARRSLVSEREGGFGFLNFIPDPKTSEINRHIAELDARMDDVRGGAGDLGDALRGPLVAGLDLTADEFQAATSSAEEFRAAVASAFGLLDRRASLRAAREAVRAFTKTLKDAPDDMRKNSAAYDEVQAALDDIAQSSLDAAEKLKGMDRVRFLEKQRGVFIDAARQMGLTAQQARRLADAFGLLDKKHAKPTVDVDNKPARHGIDQAEFWLTNYGKKRPKAKIDADNNPAKGKVDETNQWLDILGHRATHPKIDVTSNAGSIASQTEAILNNISDEIVEIHTVRTGAGGQGKGYSGADGMTIPGPRFPYMDQTLILAAPGEELITNRHGEADQFRADRAAGRIPAYADGGAVGQQRVYARHSSTTRERVVERIVETLPRTITFEAGELGRIVIDTVEGRIDASDQLYAEAGRAR